MAKGFVKEHGSSCTITVDVVPGAPKSELGKLNEWRGALQVKVAAQPRDGEVDYAAVKLSGASRLTVRMDGRLDARLSGVSHLGLIGNPVMGNIRTSGASRLSME